MRLPNVRTPEQLVALVEEIGFLPFFCNEIDGFSVEDITSEELWFIKGIEGPWEWREVLAENRTCIYGKLFHGKTGLVSRDWFPQLANYRRDGYDFDARWDDGLAHYRDKQLMDLLEQEGPCLSPRLRALAGVEKGRGAWFEAAMTRLQMQTYVLPTGFIFNRDKLGRKYGYGTARFDLPERWLGTQACTGAYQTEPSRSFDMILDHMRTILPDVERPLLERLLR